MFKPLFVALLIAAALLAGPAVVDAGAAFAQGLGRVEIGARAPGFSLTGADGRLHSLRGYRGKVVVLEWTSPVCPFTKIKYDDGTMQALQRSARERGAVWLTINTSSPKRPGYLTRAAAKARVTQTGAVVTQFLLDNGGRVGRLYGTRATPGFFIIGKDGRLAYQGAIDDDFRAEGKVTRNFVQMALDDLAARRPLREPETKAYGCAVEY